MRKVGEPYLGQLPDIQRSRDKYKRDKRNNIRNVPTPCYNEGCDKVTELSVNFIRSLGINEYLCWDCKQKGKKEINDALIALAKRKGLI